MTATRLTLVGDGVENPWNARVMIHTAQMFAAPCLFRDRGKLVDSWRNQLKDEPAPGLLTCEQLRVTYKPVVAFDNVKNAEDVYGYRLPPGSETALVVGNERLGIAADIRRMADAAVQIPMFSRTLNCLNVAAASAVGLYYMWHGGCGRMQLRAHPNRRRPEVLFVGPRDHVELGSAIRSCAAFGWWRLLLEDRERAWFGCDRVVRSEGRGAARRGRNPIHVVPAERGRRYAFEKACVVTRLPLGAPIHKAMLSGGLRQLIAIPDESAIDVHSEDWSRLARDLRFVHLDVPQRDAPYHYRVAATIALAEIMRQVGRPSRPSVGPPARAEPTYDSSLDLLTEQAGEPVHLDELLEY